ncbi:flavin reductase family protein [Rhodococcus fascians]|nr:flavin reductase family protein [Rhodococcus fascians]MBY4238005.1 flavin reductase family protein [Rhodococcus fascians]MBY4253244.1 flavin reductase family protein [Rhodococcus fascians]MBY4268881.1 flavin reductase family protein [Rhodococcus fascians]
MPNAVATEEAQRTFREVTGHYPTGVAVVTGVDPSGELLALVVGTFSSVSLDPPLVSFMPMKTSRTFAKMEECSSLCINIVGGDQEREVMSIARRWENKFEGIDWHESPHGSPVLTDAIGWMDTKIWKTVDAGDHWIVLCEVQDMAITNPVSPLIFFQGGYGSFVCTSLLARMDHEILPAIHAAHAARSEVEALAADIGCEVSVLTAVSADEMATVLSATAPGVDRDAALAQRIPIVPPIGDSYVFDLPSAEQNRWIDKLKGEDQDTQVHRDRLDFIREHGYGISFLPVIGSDAYSGMRQATKQYESGRLTPRQEREIRAEIGRTSVDYRPQTLDDRGAYNVGSVVLPVRDPSGRHTLTLRLAQLPQHASGRQVAAWIEKARAVVSVLETAPVSTDFFSKSADATVGL